MKLTLNWTDRPQPATGFDNIQDARDYQAANGGLVIFDDSANCYRVYSRDNMSDIFEQGCGDIYSKDIVDAAYAQALDGITIGEFHDLCEKYSEPEEEIE